MAVVTSSKKEENTYELLISIGAQAFEEAVNKVYFKVRGNIRVNGFRKGKVPRHVIEKIYGENAFFEDAVRDLAPGEILAAVKNEGLELVDTPEMEVVSVSKEAGLELKVRATVKPNIKLSGYKGIKIDKTVAEVTDSDVEERLNRIRERSARLIAVEDRAARLGDTALVNFEGFADGKPLEQGKGENFSIVLGSGEFIPGFEDQIVGRRASEKFTINVTFPDDYSAVELQGKDAEFNVELIEVLEKELPDLEDEFAKDVTEFETLDEFKADLRERLLKINMENAGREAEDALFTALADNVDAEIPAVMIEQKISEMVQDVLNNISNQNISMSTYLSYIGKDMGELRDSFREVATLQVKVRLALEKIAEAEGLTVDDDEVDAEIKELAEKHGLTLEKIKALVKTESVRADLLTEKAAALVKESADVDWKKFETGNRKLGNRE